MDVVADVGPSIAMPYNIAPQDTFWYTDGVSTNDFSLSTAAVTYPAVLAAYTGTGTINLHAAFSGAVTFSPDSGPDTMQPLGNQGGDVTGEDFTASVTYTYNAAVPEPAATSVLGLAAAGMLRRRRSRAWAAM